MELNLNLHNLDAATVTIKEITFKNATGLTSSIETSSIQNPAIASGKHTVIAATFDHIHDKKLFYETGLPGLVDSTYAISVLYEIQGKENLRALNLVSTLPGERFLAYQKVHATPIHTYLLSGEKSFVEKQKTFLVTNEVSPNSTFVHVTDQEIAVAGLNFKIKCFYKTDSLYTELFAVNHSELELAIDTASLVILVDGRLLQRVHGSLTLDKVTGLRQATAVLAKGDRTSIKMRYKVDRVPKEVSVAIANSLILRNGTHLFHNDLLLRRSPEQRATDL